MTRARVPKDRQVVLTKPEIAIEEIGRVVASGARFGCVLADSGYGSSAAFRQALSERGLSWAVGLSRRQNVYPADVALIFPVAKTGKRGQHHIPDWPPVSADAMLAGETWRKITWRRGTRGRLTCLFTARRVRVADGHKDRMLDDRMQCMPGDEVWLVGERRPTGEQKPTSRTCRPRPRSRGSPPRSRPGGSVSRRISSSRRNSALTTFKADPGPDYIDMP